MDLSFFIRYWGKSKNAKVKLHNLRWVIGSRIEDIFDVLRKD